MSNVQSGTSPTAADTAPEKTRWGQVVVLVIAGIAAAMMFSKVAAIFIPVRDAFGTDDVVAGMAMSLPALVAVVLGVSAGVLVGGLGARTVLLACLIGGAALSLSQSIAMPIWLFLVLRVVEGAAHLGIVVAAPVIIISVTALRQRGVAMAVWSMFFGLAFAITGWIAPSIAAMGGPSLVFVAHGVLMVLIAIAVFVLVKRGVAPSDELLTASRFLREHVETYRNPRAVLPGAVFIWHTFMYTAILTFVPLFGNERDVPFLLVAMPLISILGTVISGALLRFVPAGIVLVAGYVLVGSTILAVWAVVASGGEILIIAGVLMLFSGLIQGASFALIPALSGDSGVNARANGALTQVGNIGSVAGPPVFAGVIAASGASFGPFAIVVAIACVAGLALSLVAWRVSTRTDGVSSHS